VGDECLNSLLGLPRARVAQTAVRVLLPVAVFVVPQVVEVIADPKLDIVFIVVVEFASPVGLVETEPHVHETLH